VDQRICINTSVYILIEILLSFHDVYFV